MEQQSSLLLLVVVTQDVVMKDVDYRFFGRIYHQHLIVPDGIFILIGGSYLHPNIFWRPQKFSFRQRRSDIDLRVCRHSNRGMLFHRGNDRFVNGSPLLH